MITKHKALLALILGLFMTAGTAQAATVRNVPAEYPTIQAAVTAATAGDTILIAPGPYAESVLVDKSLTLDGGSGAKPVISGLAPSNYIVKVSGANSVVLNNIEVNGGVTNSFDYGIWLTSAGTSGSPVEIKGSTVKNIWNTSGNGIQVENNSYALVHHSAISSFHKRGIRFINSGGKFYSNEITGDNVDGTNRVQNLVNLWGGSNVEIYGNNLHNALSSVPLPTWDSPAIFISSYGGSGASQADVHDNEIYNSDTGIVITSVYATTDTSSATVTNNNFHNLKWGINFEQETGSLVAHNNSFSTVNKAINAEGNGAPLANPPAVNAENNWWGTASSTEIAALVYSVVDFNPWYMNAGKTVLSSVPPTVTVNGDNPLNIVATNSFTDAGASAKDSLGNDIVVTTTGSVNSETPGTYILTYSATDSVGNTAQATRTVNVSARTNPGSRRGGGGGGNSNSNIQQTGNNTQATATVNAGEVLGAFTEPERQAQIATLKTKLEGVLTQLVTLLKQQLAAAIAAQGR